MAESYLLLLLLLTIISSSSSSSFSLSHGLTRGSSLSVQNKDDLLVSPNRRFTACFHEVGDNAYAFAVWFSGQHSTTENRTVVWMANRDAPVNGKQSKLSLWKDGNLVLVDAGRDVIWSTKTKSTSSSLQLQLHNTGNLVLDDGGRTLWQSFDYPTDTLLPNQPLTKTTKLVSSRSRTNYSSGFYTMFFDTDGILRLIYDSPETTTSYWPHPSSLSWEAGRLQYMSNRRAILDSDGQFNSSDGWKFKSADFGMVRQRIMRIDVDGNVRVYSLVEHESRMKLEIQWQAMSQPCKIHSICGPNSLCTYSRDSGRECRCLPGYTIVNPRDSSSGCEPEFKTTCLEDDCDFIELRHVEFYGYDVRLHLNYTVDACKQDCLEDNACLGFQYGFRSRQNFGVTYCCIKTWLQNGYELGHDYSMYIKLPKRLVSSFNQKAVGKSSFTDCQPPMLTTIARSYKDNNDIKPLGFIMVFGCVIGVIEIVCIVVFWYFSTKQSSTIDQNYFLAATTFRRFTYSELKKASCNFRDEIGRGGACIVYKGRLLDNRIAAIKRLNDTSQHGEAEFQAEISTIWRVNHMNLIETWGYCAEGKHRLVVYEYMENGSLAENLKNGKLDWSTRLDIATGTAKGLAYLHEESLEWVLHCDVKPHNILLDANYGPKVADFGLSRLFDRSDIYHSNFSMVRGTRGYMAPEWVFNLPITSKVDVFSYGVVVLEMITGLNPLSKHHANGEVEFEVELIEWVRSRVRELDQNRTECWVEKIVDPSISGKYDRTAMKNLVRIALQCVEEDREARPSMSQVVSMLFHV